jgi:hypothetical protein
MLRFQAGRFARWLSPVLMVAACAACSGFGQTVQTLGDRLQVQLKPDIDAGRVTLEPLPDGARVTLVEAALYPRGGAELDDQGRSVLTSVIQALLEPSLLQIEVAQSPAVPGSPPGARVQAVTQYFNDARLGPSLQQAAPPQAVPPDSNGSAPPGLTITVRITSG